MGKLGVNIISLMMNNEFHYAKFDLQLIRILVTKLFVKELVNLGFVSSILWH